MTGPQPTESAIETPLTASERTALDRWAAGLLATDDFGLAVLVLSALWNLARVEEASAKAIRELRDLIEDLNDGPWGAASDPQVGIQNVIDFTLKPALEEKQ